jgi:hypothetical protein
MADHDLGARGCMGGDNDLLFRPAADAPGSAKAGPVVLPQHELLCSIRRQSDTGAPASQWPVGRGWYARM